MPRPARRPVARVAPGALVRVFAARACAIWGLAALGLAAPAPVHGQGFNTFNGRNHPELRWREAETAHFLIRYPSRLAGIEDEVAAIAESTYAALSHNLGVTFDRKIPAYFTDEDEIVNGFASPIGGYTMIWARPNGAADTFTGREKWLRKVVAHELTHLFHYRATRSNLGLLGYVFANPTPRFWAEGLAQYETETWDAERGERWVRTATLEHRLAFDDGAAATNGQLLYAVGNAMVRFFAAERGDSTLRRLLAHRTPVLLGLGRVHNPYDAFPAVTGETFEGFYDRWLRHITTQMGARAAGFAPPESLGVHLGAPGQYLAEAEPGPDTSKTAVVRLLSLGRPVRQLVVLDSAGERVLADGAVLAPVSWRPDGSAIAFAQTTRGAHGSLVGDLYTADTRSGAIRRLTRDRRAGLPTFASDGRRLAFAGTDGPTTDVFVMDVDTRQERRLTDFPDGTQVQGLAWRPGADEIAVALFDTAGTRALHLLDVATGGLTRLTDGAHDDRDPVWRPDGGRLAFTSLRDRVPNVFALDPATGAVARLTVAAQGATATAWLPPDARHPGGQVVVVSNVSKTQDELYLVDAARSRAEPADLVPPALARWESHRPPREVPSRIAPAPDLVVARRPYRALKNLDHVLTVPFPYWTQEATGVGLATLWFEPLGKHAFAAAAGVAPAALRRESFVTATYRNATLGPTLDATVYRFPGSARVYGPDVLVERLTGLDLRVSKPLDLGRTPYTAAQIGVLVRVARSEPLNEEDFADVTETDGLAPPAGGTQASLTLAWARRTERPFAGSTIHPLDGYGVRAALTGGAGLDRRTGYGQADLAGYAVLPGLGLQRFFVYGRAQGQVGETLPQDYLGLARYDDLQITLPAFIPITLDRNERVRGYRRYAVGKAVAFGSVEYRMPFVNLNTTLLGQLGLGATTLALFADGAVVGKDLGFKGAVRRAGVGAEVKNVVRVAALRFGHALGVAQPADKVGADQPYEVYYRIRLGVPF